MEKDRGIEKLYQVKYAHSTAKSNHIFRLEMMQNLLHQDRQETNIFHITNFAGDTKKNTNPLTTK
jgi:hypothetical protein